MKFLFFVSLTGRHTSTLEGNPSFLSPSLPSLLCFFSPSSDQLHLQLSIFKSVKADSQMSLVFTMKIYQQSSSMPLDISEWIYFFLHHILNMMLDTVFFKLGY